MQTVKLNRKHRPRFALHLNELKYIGDQYLKRFKEVETLLSNLGLPRNVKGAEIPPKFEFCELFTDHLNEIKMFEDHAKYLNTLYLNAGLNEKGLTYAKWKDLIAIKQHLKKSWKLIEKNFVCALDIEEQKGN